MKTNRTHFLLPAALMLTASMALAPQAQAQETELESLDSRFSYVLGVQFGYQILQQLRGAPSTLDEDAVGLGIADIFAGADLRLTPEEMEAASNEFQQRAEEQQMALAEQNIALGDGFRDDYANQDGIQSTESGLLYKVLETGTGEKPLAQNTVEVHYRGTLIDGTEFDSSYSRGQPAEFGLGGIIPGWSEILQLMPVGSKWEVVIPPSLAYGESGAPPAIPPHSTLVFEIELLSIK